jgi:hypothetical protein
MCTLPISINGEVWTFCPCWHDGVLAERLAYSPTDGVFIGLTQDEGNTKAPAPAYWDDPNSYGFRWATAADVEAHADLFTTH